MKTIGIALVIVTFVLFCSQFVSSQTTDCAGVVGGNATLDICGVCQGDNTTCGGCNGQGGSFDVCGVCGGDNSTCTCVLYHGYNVNQLDYVLLQETINETSVSLDCLINHFFKQKLRLDY